MENLTAIILAAGKGTRMKSKDKNKVAMEVSGEPMLVRTIKILEKSGIGSFVVVVGFAKESVVKLLDKKIYIAHQVKRLGTGHAVKCALPRVPENTKDVLILYGDDSFLYEPSTFQNLYQTHIETNAKITFITMESQNPTGFGRILRDYKNNVIGIVEEKNATPTQRKISEINLGCYIVNKKYLEANIKDIHKNSLTGEFYVTDIIDIIAKQKGRISTFCLKDVKWRGVNTKEDLKEAENLLSQTL